MNDSNPMLFVVGLVAGAAVGAAAMVFLVPQSGSQTREQVAERGVELRHRTEEAAQHAQQIARDTVAKVQVSAAELLHRT